MDAERQNFEKNTRQEYSSIIRRIDANYQNLQDNKQQEESLSMMKSRDFYASYINKFSEIRDDLAGSPQAEKFEAVKTKIDSVLGLSNQYMNNRQSILMSAFDATNAYSDYSENLSDVISYVEDYDRYSNRPTLNRRVSYIIQDSIDFHKAYRKLEKDINEKDSLVSLLKNVANSLNEVATKLHLKDTLTFHQKVIGQKSVFTEAWNNIKGANVRPNDDIANIYGNEPATTSNSKNPEISITGIICENEFSENSSKSDFEWADNYEWMGNEYKLRCQSNDAQRGTIKISYRDIEKEFPVEQGAATFSNEEIGLFKFTILGGRIGIIVRLKELFGEPDTRNSNQEYEELEWRIGNTTLFLNSRDNDSRLSIQL